MPSRALTPAETEKEMRQVMKDIGEKLPLKFRHVRDAFRPLDLSHNGKITRTEMRSFLRGFGWSHDVADRFFSALDEDDCGEIDFNVFMSHFDSVLGPANRPASRGDLIAVQDNKLRQEVNRIARILGEKLLTKFSSAREALTTLDLSNDGRITLSDMRLFFRTMCMSVDDANKMFKCLCKDGSETVDYDDFLALFGPVQRPGSRWRAVQELKVTPQTML
jgi:Ca2+-binding EF-hand superfamily protein